VHVNMGHVAESLSSIRKQAMPEPSASNARALPSKRRPSTRSLTVSQHLHSAWYRRAEKNGGLTSFLPSLSATSSGVAVQRGGNSEGWWLRGVALTQFFAQPPVRCPHALMRPRAQHAQENITI
jgi:hypothetical protein